MFAYLATLDDLYNEILSKVSSFLLPNSTAYFENPNDWLMQKSYEKNGRAEKFDYANANMNSPLNIILTSIWTIIVAIYTANAFYFLNNGGGSIFDLLFNHT